MLEKKIKEVLTNKERATDYWLTDESFSELCKGGAKNIRLTDGILEMHLESGDVIGVKIGAEKVVSHQDFRLAQVKLIYFNDMYLDDGAATKEKGCEIL